MATKTRGFALDWVAYGRFREWCRDRGMSESEAVNKALERFTGIECPYRGPGRPAKEVMNGPGCGRSRCA